MYDTAGGMVGSLREMFVDHGETREDVCESDVCESAILRLLPALQLGNLSAIDWPTGCCTVTPLHAWRQGRQSMLRGYDRPKRGTLTHQPRSPRESTLGVPHRGLKM